MDRRRHLCLLFCLYQRDPADALHRSADHGGADPTADRGAHRQAALLASLPLRPSRSYFARPEVRGGIGRGWALLRASRIGLGRDEEGDADVDNKSQMH